jgi:hypothetical protein
MSGRRWLSLAALAASGALLAGCSSGSSSSGGSPGTAQTERTAVLAAAKNLNSQVSATGVGWSDSITGLFDSCGEADALAAGNGSATMVQYTATQLVSPFNRKLPMTTFGRQMTEALNAAGWDLKPLTVSGSPGTWHTGRHDGFDLRVEDFNDGSLGATVTIDLSGSCFDAGSSAQTLKQGTSDNVNEPTPTATPTPKYS